MEGGALPNPGRCWMEDCCEGGCCVGGAPKPEGGRLENWSVWGALPACCCPGICKQGSETFQLAFGCVPCLDWHILQNTAVTGDQCELTFVMNRLSQTYKKGTKLYPTL